MESTRSTTDQKAILEDLSKFIISRARSIRRRVLTDWMLRIQSFI